MDKDWIENKSIPQKLNEINEEICRNLCKYNILLERAETDEDRLEVYNEHCRDCITRWLL